jgi:hypothetical protein
MEFLSPTFLVADMRQSGMAPAMGYLTLCVRFSSDLRPSLPDFEEESVKAPKDYRFHVIASYPVYDRSTDALIGSKRALEYYTDSLEAAKGHIRRLYLSDFDPDVWLSVQDNNPPEPVVPVPSDFNDEVPF